MRGNRTSHIAGCPGASAAATAQSVFWWSALLMFVATPISSVLAWQSSDSPQWPQGNITMQLQLDDSPPSQPLSDGATSWNSVITAALSDWNTHLTISQFAWVLNSTAPANVDRLTVNGYNNVRWGTTIYGESWGSGGDVAGITLSLYSNDRMTESDVLFNSSAGMQWDSYRGALKYQSGGQPINDLKRVALHEFGHVLGLDHPDQKGQTVAAVMNSITSNTDDLTVDDIAGGQHFYGAVLPPMIATQPIAAQFVALGGTTSDISVWVHGTPPFTYQWYRDTTALSGGAYFTPEFYLSGLVSSSYGTYKCVVTNSAGSVTSSGSILAQPGAAPIFTTQPSSQTALIGNSATFTAAAVSSPSPTYRWQKDGANLTDGGRISGATSARLTLTNVSSGDAGNYTLVATNSGAAVTSNLATLTVGIGADPGRIVNMSVNTTIGATESFTVGYVLGGSGTSGAKPILMRAMGPSLTAFHVNPALPNPYLEFYNESTLASTNEDWGGDTTISNVANAVGAFGFIATNSKDAAIYAVSVPSAGKHSVKVFSHDNGSGTVIAEIYDATSGGVWTTTTPRLINVSVQKSVGNLTTLGFSIAGSASVKVLVRAIGPGLAPFGVPNRMDDPKLAMYVLGAQTPFDSNDDWGGTAAIQAAMDATGAFGVPTNSKDAAVLETLAPGQYTAQVTPSSGNSGTAILEVYEVPQ